MEDVRGDGEEDLADDGGIDRHPIGVAAQGEEVRGAVDVVGEVVLVKEELEIGLPHVEVSGGVRKLDGDMVGDGDVADVRGVGGGGLKARGVAERVAAVGDGRRHGGGQLRWNAAADLGLGFLGGGGGQ